MACVHGSHSTHTTTTQLAWKSTHSDDKRGLKLGLISRTLLDTGEQATTCARSQVGTGVTGLSMINTHQQKPGNDAFKGIRQRQSVSDSSNTSIIATTAKVRTAKSSNEVTGCPFKAVMLTPQLMVPYGLSDHTALDFW